MTTYGRALRPSRLFLVSAVLLPLAVGARAPQTPQTAGAPASLATSASQAPVTLIAQVEVGRDGQQTTVRVVGSGGSGPLNYHVLRLSDPLRLVMDFDHASLSFPKNVVPSSEDPVHAVRLGQSQPDQVRLVIDLDHTAPYTLQSDGQSVTVVFHASSVAATSAAKPLTAAAPAPQVSAERFPLSPALTGSQPRLASQAPAPQSGPQSGASAATTAASVQDPAIAAVQLGASQPATPQVVQPAGQTQIAGGPFTGEPISVNLKDVDLKDFFRLIHEISGLNVVLDPSVRGNVTLVLDEVPWDQALEIVLRNNGLAKELNGNVLRIATQDTLKREAQDKADLAKAESAAIDTVTTTRVLSYAKAGALVVTIKRFLTPRGDVFSDDRSNTLVIRDIPSSIPQIDNLIRQLDRKSQQVAIEARVVQASRAFARDLGTQFGFANTFANNVIGGASTAISPLVHAGLAPPLVASGSSSSSLPLFSNLPATAPTSGFSFSNISKNFALDYIITAAESRGVGKLLSSPQLVTQNNAQAIVKQGTEVPIQTTINNTISVQYVDAVLELQVTPQITSDGTIFMDVLVQNTSIDNGIPLVQGIPALDTQSAQTKVLINDGGTVVIGGVMVSQQQTTIDQVPLVGSIPLIGHLFKHQSISVTSQELLFFLTPRIMPG